MHPIALRLLCLWLALCSHGAAALLVTLRDGSLIHAEIVDYDENAVVFQRLDNDASLTVAWEEIHPLCRERIREDLGLARASKVSVMIDGVKVYLQSGGVVTGKLVAERPDRLIVQTKNSATPASILKESIYRFEPARIPISAIYSPEQIYKEYSSRYDLSAADGHLQFAQFLMNARIYDKACEHLRLAESADPESAKSAALLRAQIEKNRREYDLGEGLKRIQKYRHGHRYSQALESLAELSASMDSPAHADLRNEILREQKKYLQEEIGRRWIRKLPNKTARLCRDRQMTIESACRHVLDVMPQEMIRELSEEFRVSEQAVEESMRNRIPGSESRYSYRDGSFIVASSPSSPGKAREGESRVRLSGPSRSSISPQDWWQEASGTRRSEWLCAYYWENTIPDVEILSRQCPHCGGQGRISQKRETAECESCHGCGCERIVVVR